MGTIGLPSTEDIDGLGFLANIPAAFNSVGAKRLPLTAPSADRNERRFQPDFSFMRNSLSSAFCKTTGQPVVRVGSGDCRLFRCRRSHSASRRESIAEPSR